MEWSFGEEHKMKEKWGGKMESKAYNAGVAPRWGLGVPKFQSRCQDITLVSWLY